MREAQIVRVVQHIKGIRGLLFHHSIEISLMSIVAVVVFIAIIDTGTGL